MRARFMIGALLALAGCKANTEDLRGRNLPRDAGPRDADLDAGRDLGVNIDPDSGVECVQAIDCPSDGLPYCEDFSQCRCGCFRVCASGECNGFCDDSLECMPDGGVPPQECVAASDCPSEPLLRACIGQGGPSCAFRQCVNDCVGPRSCTAEGDCVLCAGTDGGMNTLACPACAMIALGAAQVEESSCEAELALGLDVAFTAQQDCSWAIDLGANDKAVTLDDGSLIGYLERFDGPCLVTFAPTGALRTTWACPDCAFTLIHF